MSSRNQRTILRQAAWVFASLGVLLAIAASTAGAAESLSLEAVKARLRQQKEKIHSLHIRVRRVTKLSVDPKVVQSWSSRPALPKCIGTDEVLVAFKGEKRYFRLLEVDYRPTSLAGSPSETRKPLRQYLDESRAWRGEVLLQRNKNPQSGKYEYRSTPAEEARDCFPPPPYLMNVGLGISDPTASDQAHRNLQRMHLLSGLLQRWPYAVLEETQNIEGTPCAVLEGGMECSLPVGDATESKSISDKLWLDLEHGLALRQRETRVEGRLDRLVNEDFVEVVAGLWLPRQSRMESWAPPQASKQYQDRPVLVRRMSLLLWVINQVPDDLFDTALARSRSRSVPAFDLTQAYHWRRIDSAKWGGQIEEGWAVHGVGRRVEVRKGPKLQLLVVDTPRWHFIWDPAQNRVVASPSRIGQPRVEECVKDRAWVIQSLEKRTAVLACEKDRLGGKEVDKVTFYFPADPQWRNEYPIHDFDPRIQVEVGGRLFRTRTYWFDPKTNLALRRQCGCKTPKYEWWTDYPAPESVPKGLFTFQVPRSAVLEVNDPQLGRQLYSEGEIEPDLRQ